MKKLYFFGGPSGVGKTRLTKHISNELLIPRISTGDIMLSLVKDYFNLSIQRDQFKNKNSNGFQDYLIFSLVELLKYSKESIITDSHYTVMKNNNPLLSINEFNLNYLASSISKSNYSGCELILIDAETEQIMTRGYKDTTRARINPGKEKILLERLKSKEHQEVFFNIFNKYLPTKVHHIMHSNIDSSFAALSYLFKSEILK